MPAGGGRLTHRAGRRLPCRPAATPATALLLTLLVPLAAAAADLGAGASGRAPADETVAVVIDDTVRHQTIEGFGATHLALVYPGLGDVLGAPLRNQAIEAVYGQVGLTLGHLEAGLLESPGSYEQRANDNDDPFAVNWAGFQTFQADAMKQLVLDLARPLGFDNFSIAQKVNVRWASPWLDAIRNADYERYLNEAAEQVVTGQIYWRDTYGVVPSRQMLMNEPLSGNRELLNGTTQDVVDLIKRIGARLRAAGFATMTFVVPNEETVEQTLATATAILSDPTARPYVGTIGYHCYPYGSAYASVARILATSGAGTPVAAEVAVRHQLRDLAARYGVDLWMTEVSHGEVDPRAFDGLRARAIHIHDELVHADASAYFGMLNMWDTVSQRNHVGNDALFTGDNEGHIAFVDTDANSVTISAMGYAIGHYARWVKRGAVRVEASSSDPLLQVTAFRDDAAKRVIAVLINNAGAPRRVRVSLTALRLAGNLTGEQSTASTRWTPLLALPPSEPRGVTIELPAESVTTVAAAYDEAPRSTPTDAVPPPTGTVPSPSTATPVPLRTETRTAEAPRTATVGRSATAASTATTTVPTTSATATPTSTTDTGQRRGDVNCDGRITAADLPALVALMPRTSVPACASADTDGDGTVDRNDFGPLVRAIFGAEG